VLGTQSDVLGAQGELGAWIVQGQPGPGQLLRRAGALGAGVPPRPRREMCVQRLELRRPSLDFTEAVTCGGGAVPGQRS